MEAAETGQKTQHANFLTTFSSSGLQNLGMEGGREWGNGCVFDTHKLVTNRHHLFSPIKVVSFYLQLNWEQVAQG